MTSSLVSNLLTTDFSKFLKILKVFIAGDLLLVTRLKETNLTVKYEFYSTLTEAFMSDKDYNHATTVWKHFGCRTFGEYSDLNLKMMYTVG